MLHVDKSKNNLSELSELIASKHQYLFGRFDIKCKYACVSFALKPTANPSHWQAVREVLAC